MARDKTAAPIGRIAMKTILVLGGAGYIGSHTVYELIDGGYDVAVADNLETGFIEAVHPKARFYKGDIRDRSFIDSVFDAEKIDAVIHFAANSQVGESMIKPLKYYENNMGGTTLLVAAPAEPDRPCVLGILFRPRENHRATRGRVLCDEACPGRHDAWAVRLYRAGEHRPGTGLRP